MTTTLTPPRLRSLPQLSNDQIDEFLAKLEPDRETGCWLWTGGASGGYGRLTIDGQSYLVHRIALAMVGADPGDLPVDHKCRRPLCCSPQHLEAVTSRQNALRGQGITAQNARKFRCKRGHLLEGENVSTVRTPWGRGRRCVTCRRRSEHYGGAAAYDAAIARGEAS